MRKKKSHLQMEFPFLPCRLQKRREKKLEEHEEAKAASPANGCECYTTRNIA